MNPLVLLDSVKTSKISFLLDSNYLKIIATPILLLALYILKILKILNPHYGIKENASILSIIYTVLDIHSENNH